LVADGAGNTVMRLGLEANGGWEIDYVGQTLAEQQDWAHCYDNEVTAMRAVTGAHFLFVWNPNVCTNDLGLANWYPGNAYVDIIGADAYDLDCNTLKTVAQEGWAAYYIDGNAGNDDSLSAISAFAVSHSKPMSLPEWGEDTGQVDDPAYVQGIASVVNDGDFSFQAYFDCGTDSVRPLGSSEPQSTAAYMNAFA
jgi:beta-mannanase